MKTTYVSTQTVSGAMRRSILDMQTELTQRQKELTTGRLADVGLSLGARTGESVALRTQSSGLQTLLDGNAIASSRLSATQGALQAMADDAGDFVGELIEAKSNPANAATLVERAKDQLGGLVGAFGTTYEGAHLFGGINTDAAPVADYFGPPASAAKQAVDAAFQARFGMSQDDPAVSTISASDLEDFLDTDFAGLFDDANWAANWSSASDEVTRSRISSAEQVTTGTTANDPAMRKLAMAYTMMADLGAANLSDEAYETLVGKAASVLGDGTQGLTAIQGQLGFAQEAVTKANDRISSQMDVLATHIGSLEDVDPYEASTRVNDLITQLETAYTVTGRLQQLSLLDYL